MRANAIRHGDIEMPDLRGLVQSKKQIEHFEASLVASIPLDLMSIPDEVANVVLFFLSSEINVLVMSQSSSGTLLLESLFSLNT
jgi:NAD(P)-dependent dehydrogenase (short-subunit alcohol dehydrogenase family)